MAFNFEGKWAQVCLKWKTITNHVYLIYKSKQGLSLNNVWYDKIKPSYEKLFLDIC